MSNNNSEERQSNLAILEKEIEGIGINPKIFEGIALAATVKPLQQILELPF